VDADARRTAERRAARAVAERYLVELHARDPELDVLVLGCTHYPLLRPLLSECVASLWSHPVTIVDSAHAMARAVDRELAARTLHAHPRSTAAALDCFVTDETRFAELGARFLGHPLASVERVDLA
jgi:glutamate racemase